MESIAVEASTNAAPAEPAPRRRKKRLYTLEEYLRLEEQSQERHIYDAGKIIRIPMAKGPHNIITLNIGSAIKVALKTAGKTSYVVFSSNQKVYLPSLDMGLYPDVLVVGEAPEYWDENQLLLINPLLIVEVLSPSTRKFDLGGKLGLYKTLPSLREYALVEADQCKVTTSFCEEPDLWRDAAVTDIAGLLPLRSLDCSIAMAEVYENVELKV